MIRRIYPQVKIFFYFMFTCVYFYLLYYQGFEPIFTVVFDYSTDIYNHKQKAYNYKKTDKTTDRTDNTGIIYNDPRIHNSSTFGKQDS